MSLYDTEQFIRDLETMFKAGLNTEITALNSEKGDFNIEAIDSNAWYFHNLNTEVFSYDQFIVFSMAESPGVVDPQEDNFIEQIVINFEVVLPDLGEESAESFIWKLLRYTRALKTVAFKNFDSFQGRAKIKVQSLIPTSFSFDGKMFRSAGVSITAAITAY